MPWVEPEGAVLRDLHIGRLGLPTINDPITEQLGSDVTNVGDYTAVGQRKAKGFTFDWVVAGFNEALPVAAGNRMRRQLRSLVQNEAYRLAGVYLMFTPDAERNGWLVIGEAQLADNDGGVTFGSYKLTISQAFIVGNQSTHRDGYRCDVTDLRQVVPVDYLGQNINTTGDFATLPILPIAVAPTGATDPVVLDSPVPTGQRASSAGPVTVIPNRGDGDVLTWERPDSAYNAGDDVVIYDRRGNTETLPTP